MRAFIAVLGITLVWAAQAHAVEATNGWQTDARSLAIGEAGVKPPLAVAWRHEHPDIGHDVFAAAGGRVFLFATRRALSSDDLPQTTVEAFDARSGQLIWSREVMFALGGAYGDGTLVVTGTEREGAAMYALDATTGEIRWRAARWERRSLGLPIVADGRIHVGVSGGDLDTLSLADGAHLWTSPTAIVTYPSGPAVGGSTVLTYGADLPWGFDAADGAQRFAGAHTTFRYNPIVAGTDGSHVYGYTHDGDRIHINSPTTGAQELLISGARQPAVGRNRMWYPYSQAGPMQLNAMAWRGQSLVETWHVTGNWDSPLLVGDVIYARTYDTHCLYAFDARSGESLWRSDPLHRDALPGVDNAPLVADETVYVPHADGVAALRSSAGAPSGSCPPHEAVRTADYDAAEPFPPLEPGTPPPARPTQNGKPRLTAIRRRGGFVRAVVKPIPPGTRTRFRIRCGRRTIARKTTRAGSDGAARVTMLPPHCGRTHIRVVAVTPDLVGRVRIRSPRR